jgi:hypothetical protein
MALSSLLARRPRRAAVRGTYRPQAEVLENRLVPATTSQEFIGEVYRELLNREADPAGLAAWSALVDQGVPRPLVVFAIESSVEYRAVVIDELYRDYLNRPADPTGLNAFVQFVGLGGTFDQVRATILGSGEYFARAGGNNQNFLERLYEDALGRPLDPTGQAAWGQLLGQGAPRGTVAALVLSSPEADRFLVEEWYNEFLDRSSDAGGLATFANLLQSGQREEVAVALIVGSDEFFRNA